MNLELKSLDIGYRKTMLQDINVTIESPKLIGIVGRNGSGKSTLMKTLLKLIPPKNGEIILNDTSINQYTNNQWATCFAAVFSRLSHIPHLRARDVMRIGTRSNETLEEKVTELLGIRPLLGIFADELSDGQLQKILIARAICQNTPYLILDEPTAHLDYVAKKEILYTLKQIVATLQRTVLVISHEVELIAKLSDEVWWIEESNLRVMNPLRFKNMISCNR